MLASLDAGWLPRLCFLEEPCCPYRLPSFSTLTGGFVSYLMSIPKKIKCKTAHSPLSLEGHADCAQAGLYALDSETRAFRASPMLYPLLMAWEFMFLNFANLDLGFI